MTPEEIAFMEKNHPDIFYAASRNPYASSSPNGRSGRVAFSQPHQQLELALCI